MARSIAQALNLIRTTTVTASYTTRNALLRVASRSESTQADRSTGSDTPETEAEALAVQRIEEAIHRIIVRRSAPDWLPFRPGASYWVPPRRSSYGVADLVHKLANTLTEEEIMSLATFRGWPSSNFYLDDDKCNVAKKEIQSEDEEV
ncbi:hypothetical protein MTR67_028321 [Solanum verrucosum]|uniref:Uncharacterized protein n=1 Tax=Solanum verrucosum TaxID=315347 RepID=A0AAF0R3W7_SOLVR|nr:uncharacterized protein LOC125874950 [Solanum stenotomum]WMV34936.1 hypothetical protein MTR67_028321 [Solanum verrucosum]